MCRASRPRLRERCATAPAGSPGRRSRASSGARRWRRNRVDGDRYQNPRYGVQIEKPPRWHFITASTVMDVARKAAGHGAPPADADPVKTAGFAVIVSKSPNLGREVSPQVVPDGAGPAAAARDVVAGHASGSGAG